MKVTKDNWPHLIPIVYALLVLVALFFLIGCGSVAPVVKEQVRLNETSGWVGVGLYQYDDGKWIIERYEPTMGWRSFEFFDTPYVSAHFIKFAEGFCMEARTVDHNSNGTLTNQTLTSDYECNNFDNLYNVTRGRLDETL